MAAVPLLLLQLAGCASSAATRADAPAAAGEPQPQSKPAKPARSDSAADGKAFAEAVKRGDKAWQADELDRAVYYYVLALDHSPQDASTLAKIGAIKQHLGQSALAEKAFEMAHSAQPDDPRIAERLAQLYLQQDKVDAAERVYAQVLALHPQRSRALDGMGDVCVLRANYPQAIQYFDQALQGDKADAAGILTHRGYAKLRLLDLAGAESDLRSVLATTSRPDAWRYLADLQVRQHDNAGAYASLSKIMDSAHAYNEIGLVLLNMNSYGESHSYFAKAISASATWYDEAQRNLELADEQLNSTADASSAPRAAR
jgi:tetratricopeptide (TPR) repeat protein